MQGTVVLVAAVLVLVVFLAVPLVAVFVAVVAVVLSRLLRLVVLLETCNNLGFLSGLSKPCQAARACGWLAPRDRSLSRLAQFQPLLRRGVAVVVVVPSSASSVLSRHAMLFSQLLNRC